MFNLDTTYHNNLVASIRKMTGDKFYHSMEIVRLKSGEILYDSESTITHVYFPTTAIISLSSTMEDGATSEIASVGYEGMIGVPLFMGSDVMSCQAQVQSSGYALRLKSEFLLEEFNESPTTQLLLLRYAQSLFTQISHNAACNRHHSVHQQLCRWLLSSLDRQSTPELNVTHESIAAMLGVRRESITQEVGELKNSGIIDKARGQITILDRKKLEAHACECYCHIKKEFARLLTTTPALTTPPRVHTDRNMLVMAAQKAPRRQISASF